VGDKEKATRQRKMIGKLLYPAPSFIKFNQLITSSSAEGGGGEKDY
jgi:hypothetical protein